MSKKTQFKKQFFDSGASLGINSFKFISYPSFLCEQLILLKTECIERLEKGITNGATGISLTIESPVYCRDYAEFNVFRKVPLRQYFGEDLHEDRNGIATRTAYGVGSGNATVGGDRKMTKTRLMTTVMKNICEYLSSEAKVFTNNGKKCRSDVHFNHVTVLYYLSESGRPEHKINLNPHSDMEVTAKNEFKLSNSQTEHTPTVVISFVDSKDLVFYKRNSDGNRFGEISRVTSMTMNDMDIFVLHPHDERVVKRRLKLKNHGNVIEDTMSQFKHGVSFSSSRPGMNEEGYGVSISVCLRHVSKTEKVRKDLGVPISEETEYTEMKEMSEFKKRKIELIESKRKQMSNEDKMAEMNERLKSFHIAALDK